MPASSISEDQEGKNRHRRGSIVVGKGHAHKSGSSSNHFWEKSRSRRKIYDDDPSVDFSGGRHKR